MSAIIRLEPKQSRRVNALVRRECCNYDNGNCILLDCTCPQTITYSHIICKWFKTAVLPLDKELHIELMKPNVELSMMGDTFLKIKARQPCQGGEVEIFVRKYYLLP